MTIYRQIEELATLDLLLISRRDCVDWDGLILSNLLMRGVGTFCWYDLEEVEYWVALPPSWANLQEEFCVSWLKQPGRNPLVRL